MVVNVAGAEVLERLLMRKRRPGQAFGVDLGLVLREILQWADRFIPSEAGSILLDDPALKREPDTAGKLYYVACFGQRNPGTVGESISQDNGVAGEAYRGGKPVLIGGGRGPSGKASGQASSIVCAPIAIHQSVVGAIELVNSKGKAGYDKGDLAMLEIFAGYTATLMENALDARGFEELSKRDGLTGLHNDRYMFTRLEQEVERSLAEGSDTSLIFLDLDRFKEINDNYGHLSGSRALAELGGILRGVFNGTGSVLARYGGDEFVAIMPGRGIEEGMKYAEALRSAIKSHVFLKESGPDYGALNIRGIITCSVGVASQSMLAEKSRDVRLIANALIKAADDAMYRAKESGKDRALAANPGSGTASR